ncbi:hypothetical protein PISMIDRAFT_680627, partial [Pisolithus microcarpus 441]
MDEVPLRSSRPGIIQYYSLHRGVDGGAPLHEGSKTEITSEPRLWSVLRFSSTLSEVI